MKQLTLIVVSLLCAAMLPACVPSKESPRGFRLPDGDYDKGRETFVSLGCNGCHIVAGVELPAPEVAGPVRVELGGEVTRVETYGHLVTSIINPSHELAPGHPPSEVSVDGKSRMTIYNDVMTVSQLVDLVAFLQACYEVVPPPYEYYQYGP